MTIILSMLASAWGFIKMPFKRLLPIPPDPEKIKWQPNRSWFHNAKNEITERFRADAQWWSKFMCFLVVVAFAIGLAIG